jgi:hypothetical protein
MLRPRFQFSMRTVYELVTIAGAWCWLLSTSIDIHSPTYLNLQNATPFMATATILLGMFWAVLRKCQG